MRLIRRMTSVLKRIHSSWWVLICYSLLFLLVFYLAYRVQGGFP